MKSSCIKEVSVPKPPQKSRPSIVVRRYAALGDAIAASCVADKLDDMGYNVIWESHPSAHCLMRRQPSIAEVREPNGNSCAVNLDGAYEKHPLRKSKSFSSIFMDKANSDLARLGINLGPSHNCKPELIVEDVERLAAQNKFSKYPKPWTFICPRSDHWKNRTVPDGIWTEAAKKINGTKFWLGWKIPAPAGIVDLQCLHVDNLVVWLSVADLLITVDTGPMHIGAALGIPIIALGQASSPELHLSDQRDFITLNCPGLDCLNCNQNICPLPNQSDMPPCQNFDPDQIAALANKKLGQIYGNDVSAIIPVFGPDPQVFQRCLDCVAPQVQEVIVTAETADKLPHNLRAGGKIKVIVKGVKGIGYGRNCSFGTRHSTGKFVLHLNDDCYLDPGAVESMLKEMRSDTGIVCNLLRRPDGMIWHAGKRRNPGQRGWGHIDHGMKDCTINQVTEMENCAGTAILMRRKAFYSAGCYDEDIIVYCEDDMLALNVRRVGYKILFTPFSTGVHVEHQSTCKLGNIMDQVKRSNVIFDRKLGNAYFNHNANNSFGNFDF